MLKRCPICNGEPTFERDLNGITLLQCRMCEFVYSNLADQQIESVNFSYGIETAGRYEEMRGSIDRHWFNTIAAGLNNYAGKAGRVLDIGCGDGLLLSMFGKLGWETYGCDPSPWAVDAAHRYGFTLYNRELKDSDLDSDYFDLVTCIATLEHIPRPVELVNEIRRILSPNGVAYFVVPNYRGLAIRLGCATFRRNAPPWHCNFFTAEALRHLFAVPGLRTIYLRSYGIPEAYGVYQGIRKVFRLQRQKVKQQEKPDNVKQQDNPIPKPSSSIKAKLLVNIYYYAGRPFSWGDKLEALVSTGSK